MNVDENVSVDGSTSLANDFTDAELLFAYCSAIEGRKTVSLVAGRLQKEIYERMEQAGTTSMPSEEFICELEQQVTNRVGRPRLKFEKRNANIEAR